MMSEGSMTNLPALPPQAAETIHKMREDRVLSALTNEPQHLREIAYSACVTTYEAQVALTDLSRAGKARQTSATQSLWVKS
jgi:hypothetical protein